METEEQGMEVVDDTSTFSNFLAHYGECEMHAMVWPHIEACARFGVLHSSPTCTILARVVDVRINIDNLNALDDLLEQKEIPDEHKAWFIIYASGKPHEFFKLDHEPTKWLIWQKNGGTPHIWNYETVKKKVYGSRI